MAKGIYVSATTPGSGKSLVALGLADTLHRHADRIGFFKPVVHGDDAGADPMVALMRSRFDLDDRRCRGGLTFTEVRGLLADVVAAAPTPCGARGHRGNGPARS